MHPLRSCKYSSSRLLDGPRTNLFSIFKSQVLFRSPSLHQCGIKYNLSTISHGLIYCYAYSTHFFLSVPRIRSLVMAVSMAGRPIMSLTSSEEAIVVNYAIYICKKYLTSLVFDILASSIFIMKHAINCSINSFI